MKVFLLLCVVLFTSEIFAQNDADVQLSPKKFKQRIVKREFPDIPQNVRDFHAQGTITVHVIVNEEGNVSKVKFISSFGNLNEYLEKTIANWKFKPLEIDGEKVSFKGLLQIPFCYGGFFSCY